MANVVFDKQVAFSEQYTQKLSVIIRKLVLEGPSPEAISFGNELRNLRISFAPWLSKDLNEKLLPYEQALREIGALAELNKLAPNDPHRSATIMKMYSTVSKFLGINFGESEKEPEDFALIILEHLQEIIGIPDLEQLRGRAIQLALTQLQ